MRTNTEWHAHTQAQTHTHSMVFNGCNSVVPDDFDWIEIFAVNNGECVHIFNRTNNNQMSIQWIEQFDSYQGVTHQSGDVSTNRRLMT